MMGRRRRRSLRRQKKRSMPRSAPSPPQRPTLAGRGGIALSQMLDKARDRFYHDGVTELMTGQGTRQRDPCVCNFESQGRDFTPKLRSAQVVGFRPPPVTSRVVQMAIIGCAAALQLSLQQDTISGYFQRGQQQSSARPSSQRASREQADSVLLDAPPPPPPLSVVSHPPPPPPPQPPS